MANITITAAMAQSGIQPLEVAIGVPQTVFSTYSFSASPTVSQMILMCKIPDGARVLDVVLHANNVYNKGGVSLLSVGTPDSINRFISSCTLSAGMCAHMGIAGNAPVTGTLGWLNDMSDNASPKYRYLQVSVSAAASTSASPIITTALTYVIDRTNT